MWALLTGGTAVFAKTAIALVGVVAIEHHVANTLLLLLVLTSVMYAAFRAYAGLYLRHERVEKLYRFTRAVASSVAAADVSDRAVCEARELLGAEGAELARHGSVGLVVSCDAVGQLTRGHVGKTHATLADLMRSTRGSVCATPGAHDGIFDGWLARRGWGIALVAPLGADGGAGWLAVGRNADDEFAAADQRLFEAIANHLSVALENSRLIDELSAEVRDREHRAMHDPLTDLRTA